MKYRFWVAVGLVIVLGLMVVGMAIVGTMAEARGVDLNIDPEVSTLLGVIGGGIVGALGGFLGGNSRTAVETVPATPDPATPDPAPTDSADTDGQGQWDSATALHGIQEGDYVEETDR